MTSPLGSIEPPVAGVRWAFVLLAALVLGGTLLVMHVAHVPGSATGVWTGTADGELQLQVKSDRDLPSGTTVSLASADGTWHGEVVRATGDGVQEVDVRVDGAVPEPASFPAPVLLRLPEQSVFTALASMWGWSS